MTDREKAFCINGLRNHLHREFASFRVDPSEADRRLMYVAKRMRIKPELLDLTRREHQEFLEAVIDMIDASFRDGN
jgi:hypothetical protein